jgi:phosphoribosylanthranilate isomerase
MLATVTITGADDGVDPKDLIALSREFNFVEWAILFSVKKFGEPRYPSLPWVAAFAEAVEATWTQNPALEKQTGKFLRLIWPAAHFCGQMARDTQAGKPQWLRMVHGLKVFKRIQLNGFDVNAGFPALDASLKWEGGTDFILQIRSEEDLPKAKEVQQRLNPPGVLFDASGGRGISPDKWPSNLGIHRMGWAGGINPDNVRSIAKELNAVSYRVPFWIDMETGVRTDDKFDLAKVRDVLTKVAPYVDPDYTTTYV